MRRDPSSGRRIQTQASFSRIESTTLQTPVVRPPIRTPPRARNHALIERQITKICMYISGLKIIPYLIQTT
jgi:hypothetical protein